VGEFPPKFPHTRERHLPDQFLSMRHVGRTGRSAHLRGIIASLDGFSVHLAEVWQLVWLAGSIPGLGIAFLPRDELTMRLGPVVATRAAGEACAPLRHSGAVVGPFGIGFEPIDLGADETALLSVELARDRDPAPPFEDVLFSMW
jgi:hypothetical protein